MESIYAGDVKLGGTTERSIRKWAGSAQEDKKKFYGSQG